MERLNNAWETSETSCRKLVGLGLNTGCLAAESVVYIRPKKVDCTSVFSATLGQIKSDSQLSAFEVLRHQFIISFLA